MSAPGTSGRGPGGPAGVTGSPEPAPMVPAGAAPADPARSGSAPAEQHGEERHRAELARDTRVERRLAWRELGCLLFVAAFVVVRSRYLT